MEARTQTLINIAAADLITVLYLPLNYSHHFDNGWPLGPIMCTAFLILSCGSEFLVRNAQHREESPSSSRTTSTDHEHVIVTN